ncbi:hypothetical protein HETIRDRAFT_390389, partial [Heterobasidion irregulare TC 32-1]
AELPLEQVACSFQAKKYLRHKSAGTQEAPNEHSIEIRAPRGRGCVEIAINVPLALPIRFLIASHAAAGSIRVFVVWADLGCAGIRCQ